MPLLKHICQRKLLLDTHVWLWTMTEHPMIEKQFRTIFENGLKTDCILISAMSIWETGMLVDKGRIDIELDVLDWINLALDEPGIHLCPVTPKIAIQSTRLPDQVHGDPVDRVLIATAYEENAVLVTCDKQILSYGMGKFISVFDPSK